MSDETNLDSNNLERARMLILNGRLDKAQEIIDTFDTHNAEAHFLRGKIFLEKGWYSEARKQFKFAVKAEPDNAEYRQALDDLNAFRKTKEYKEARYQNAKKQMGSTDQAAEVCCLCGGEICGSVCCEALCDGCS